MSIVILFPSLYPPWVHVYLQITIPNFVFILRVPTLSFIGWNPQNVLFTPAVYCKRYSKPPSSCVLPGLWQCISFEVNYCFLLPCGLLYSHYMYVVLFYLWYSFIDPGLSTVLTLNVPNPKLLARVCTPFDFHSEALVGVS